MDILQEMFAEARNLEDVYQNLLSISTLRDYTSGEENIKMILENFLRNRIVWLEMVQQMQIVQQKDLHGKQSDTDSG